MADKRGSVYDRFDVVIFEIEPGVFTHTGTDETWQGVPHQIAPHTPIACLASAWRAVPVWYGRRGTLGFDLSIALKEKLATGRLPVRMA